MATALLTPSPTRLAGPTQSVRSRASMRKSLSLGQGLTSTPSTLETTNRDLDNGSSTRRHSSPTELLWLNLKESGLPEETPLDEVAYTPRPSRDPSPVAGPGSRRLASRRDSSLRDSERISELSGELGLTSRRSTGDTVFGSPTKPLTKRGSILRRKSSFGGFTAPNSPTQRNPKKPLTKSVSFRHLGSQSSVTEDISAWATPRVLEEDSDSNSNSKTPRNLEGPYRRGRKGSMMDTLRRELMQRDRVNVKRYAERRNLNEVKNMSAKREKSDELGVNKNAKVKFAEISHRPSMPALFGRSDSVGSDNLLSSYDVKKFQMLQSLRQMGVDLKKIRTSQDQSKEVMIQLNEESRILRAAAKGNRHGSLTSRTIISHFRETAGNATNLSPGRNVEQLDPVTREKLQKVYDQMVKPDAKMVALPGLVGRNRHSVTEKEVAADTVNVLRMKMRKRKKANNRFQKIARFVLVLLRLWGYHANRVNEMLDLVQSVDMDDKEKKEDLLFDITEFKAEKEAHVPQEAKRILKKRPSERSHDEIHYVQIALRNYKSLAEYPVHMQKRIAEKAWFEGFGPKRVIVREGHLPMSFYFVLSGSAVVSVMDMEKGVAKTVLYYRRGDSFGELAIMNATLRQSTVISKEPVELLVLSDEDFIDIFMSGGLKNPNDPFILSLPYFDGWPIEKLSENPKKAQFCYYKRGAILVKDSKVNEWIVIVKSGSCRLLKKLMWVDPTKPRKMKAKIKRLQDAIMEDHAQDKYLNHEERLALSYERQIQQLEKQNQMMRFYALPEIFVEANSGYLELKKLRDEQAEHMGHSIAEKLRESAVLSRNPTSTSMDRQRTDSALSGSKLGALVKKGPYLAKSTTQDSKDNMLKEGTRMGTSFSDFLRENMASTSALGLNKEVKSEPPSMFVNVQTLTKGMVFGLSDIFFEDQPSMTLVSNGAECITVNKKLFMDHASHAFVTRLREDIYPYPSEGDLQENMESQIYWNHHKRQQIGHVIKEINFKRSERHDARASFTPDLSY